MTIVGLDDFVKVSIWASFKSFLLIKCIDAPESTTNSRSTSSILDAGKHLFSEGEKNVALWCSSYFKHTFGQPPRCFAGTLLLPLCLLLRPILIFFGVLGLRWWSSTGQENPSGGFWSRILVWRATTFVNFIRWIGLCMSELFRKIDFGGFMSWKTQPNCRALDDRRPVRPHFNSWQVSQLKSGRPDLAWLLSRLTTGCHTFWCQSFFFNITCLLHFFHSFWTWE